MDWLRSEDLKEEKNVTASILIIAVHALFRFEATGERTIGHASKTRLRREFGRLAHRLPTAARWSHSHS
jgi:hypothetical protein